MRDDKKTASLGPASIFWNDVKSLEETVCSIVQSPQSDLVPNLLKIRTELSAKSHDPGTMTERILDYAAELLDIPTSYPPDLLQSPRERHAIALLDRWLDETGVVLAGDEPADDSCQTKGPCMQTAPNERRDEILMESLTAAWFALYFLGVPFSHIWERVRRMADERGYPSGACVTKFIGDIHRIGRLEMARELGVKGVDLQADVKDHKYDNSQTLVLSYMPFGLLRRLIYRKENHKTPAAVHRLGHCYALLQMRLYIREGFPIRYLVSQESLVQNWNKLLSDPGNDADAMFDEIYGWMENVFPNNVYHQSVELIRSNDSIAGMATCVLGRQVGMYVLDTSRATLPFAGNQLAGSLLLSYRSKLNNISRSATGNVIQLSGGQPLREERIKDILRKILLGGAVQPVTAPAGSFTSP